MKNTCFILLPTFEPEGYSKGHFNRVYQYIIAPACRQAGFSPVRLGDPTIDDTPLGILTTIIESDLLICDISSNQKNVWYGSAIRQSLGLPLVTIKDLKTNLKATIPDFEFVEYDESLRIDTVENEVPALSEALKKAIDNKSEPNNLLTRLNLTEPINQEPTATVFESTFDGEHKPEESVSKLPFISPVPDYVGDPLTQTEIERLKVGNSIFHMIYGRGELMSINKQTKDYLIKIKFEDGIKILVISPSEIFRKVN